MKYEKKKRCPECDRVLMAEEVEHQVCLMCSTNDEDFSDSFEDILQSFSEEED